MLLRPQRILNCKYWHMNTLTNKWAQAIGRLSGFSIKRCSCTTSNPASLLAAKYVTFISSVTASTCRRQNPYLHVWKVHPDKTELFSEVILQLPAVFAKQIQIWLYCCSGLSDKVYEWTHVSVAYYQSSSILPGRTGSENQEGIKIRFCLNFWSTHPKRLSAIGQRGTRKKIELF